MFQTEHLGFLKYAGTGWGMGVSHAIESIDHPDTGAENYTAGFGSPYWFEYTREKPKPPKEFFMSTKDTAYADPAEYEDNAGASTVGTVLISNTGNAGEEKVFLKVG